MKTQQKKKKIKKKSQKTKSKNTQPLSPETIGKLLAQLGPIKTN